MIERLRTADKKQKSIFRGLVTQVEHIGIPLTVENLLGALDSTFDSDIKNRRYQLAEKLGSSEEIKENLRRKERKYHDRSIRRINKTLQIYKAERIRISPEKLKKMDEVIKDKVKFKKVRDLSIDMLKDTFLEGLESEDPDVAIEVIEIFSDVFKKVEERGDVKGLYDYIEEQIEELKRARSEENRGREKRSPLPWHKIAGICFFAGVFAGLVIWCIVAFLAQENWGGVAACILTSIGAYDRVWGWIQWVISKC